MARTQSYRDPEAVEEDEQQYVLSELDSPGSGYENRPKNQHKTLPFHELYISLFGPLNESKKMHAPGVKIARAKQGPHGPSKLSSSEQRKHIILRFISRWRNEVGNDFYPALRLIIPEKDRDRPMYGLKEKAIGKLIVKLLKLNPRSEDGYNLLNWKDPGKTTASRMAGDFAGRCYEVLGKRAMRQEPGDLTIGEVNAMLDSLAAAQKEETQLPIFESFYARMNATELMWLIRIILRQMKIGATERTFLNLWHPDAEALFNVSSNLRRVCWELQDPGQRVGDEGTAPPVELMQCFQPQLAQFQNHSFQRSIEKLGCTTETPEFWIEEKLDGERMQMHMQRDANHPGGRKFAFWSRKAKDYTYLYGNGLEDDNSSLTRHLKNAFDPDLESIILDGEMITWDPVTNKIVPFGTLKTAALSEQKNLGNNGIRPLFRVFDCLFINDRVLTQYQLADRRTALERVVKDVPLRLELHKYALATTAEEIDPALRKVVAEASEGLVLKNPRSMYQLNSRNDNWVKVKPDYMTEFGESLDCVVIGGYYGTGHRGGALSSFLCGLRVGQNYKDKHPGTNPMKCLSFFKVGGGFRADDYATVRHRTDGKWIEWDREHPPDDYIILGGDGRQYERPDVWIKPNDSIVVEAKAASVGTSDQFGTGLTLRFPRFKRIRDDKNWESALSFDEFLVLKTQAEQEVSKNKEFMMESRRRLTKKLKKEIVVAGNDNRAKVPYAGPKTAIFEGLNFCVLSEMVAPQKKTKAEIEQILKANGGKIFQSPAAKEDIICISDKKLVKVVSVMKSGKQSVVKPAWVLDALQQAEIDGPGRAQFLIPFEPSHMFHTTNEARPGIEESVDVYGDSYARDVTPQNLKSLLEDMIHPKNSAFSAQEFVSQLEAHGKGLGDMRASLFSGSLAYFASGDPELLSSQSRLDFQVCKYNFLFARGKVADELGQDGLTHIIAVDDDPKAVTDLRSKVAIASGRRLPRIVTLKWLQDSWKEETILDEERYSIPA